MKTCSASEGGAHRPPFWGLCSAPEPRWGTSVPRPSSYPPAFQFPPDRRRVEETLLPFHMSGIVSSCIIITLSLRRSVFPIFDFKKCRDLEFLVTVHSRRLKVVPFDRLCMVFFSNFVFKTRFWDIRLQKCRDLEIRARGHSRSLKVAPFERLCMVSS